MSRTAELDRIMREKGLTARQVGDLIGVRPKTIRNWRSSTDRTIPEHALIYLKLRLAAEVDA